LLKQIAELPGKGALAGKVHEFDIWEGAFLADFSSFTSARAEVSGGTLDS